MRSLLAPMLVLSLMTGAAGATPEPAPKAPPPEDVWGNAFGDAPPDVKTPDAPADSTRVNGSLDGGLLLVPRLRYHRTRETSVGAAGTLRIGYLLEVTPTFKGGIGLDIGGGGYTDGSHEWFGGLALPFIGGPVVFRLFGGFIVNNEDTWGYFGAELGYRLDLLEFGIQLRGTSEVGDKFCAKDDSGVENCEMKVVEDDGSVRDPRTQAWGPGLYVGIHF